MPGLSWLWWNATGFVVTVVTAYGVSLLTNYYSDNYMEGKTAFKWTVIIQLIWGAVCFSLFVIAEKIHPDILSLIVEAGSLIFGCMLGVFLVGICNKKHNCVDCLLGLMIGYFINIFFWLQITATPWFLWSAAGLLVTVILGYLIWLIGKPETKYIDPELLTNKERLLQPGIKYYSIVLIGFFIFMILFSVFMKYLF